MKNTNKWQDVVVDVEIDIEKMREVTEEIRARLRNARKLSPEQRLARALKMPRFKLLPDE